MTEEKKKEKRTTKERSFHAGNSCHRFARAKGRAEGVMV